MTIDALLSAIKGRTLNLSERGLTALPDDLSPLADRIQRLDLSKNALTGLPDSLATLTRLTTLVLSDNQLTTLPDAFGGMTALVTLDVRRNRLRDLPPSLVACEKLRTLRMAANRMSAVPDVLWRMPPIATVDGIVGLSSAWTRTSARALYELLATAESTPEARSRAFALASGKTLDALSAAQIAEAMQIPNDIVRSNGLRALLRRGDYASEPLAAGSRVFVMGAIHGKKTELKARLAAVDASYAIKIDPKVTHVIVGRKPKKWDGIDRAGLVFCSEQQVMETLDQLDTPYLVEEVQESPEAAEDVVEMLQSPDRDTVSMALDLLKAGGVPAAVHSALFYVGKAMGDKKLGAKARKLLKVHGSEKVRAAVADRGKLFSVGHKAEKKTAESLGVYSRKAPELDWPAIALLIKRDHGVGLRFIIDRCKVGDPARVRALRMMVKDGTLDMFSHYAGHMPDYFNSYAHYWATDFPPEIYEFTDLTGLILCGCRIRELPKGISALSHLRTLNLDGNMLEGLPDDFGQLTGLESLDLGRNLFPKFPTEQVTKLTRLKTLRFVGNRGEELDKRPDVLTVPDAVRAALPNCTFEDGPHSWQASYWRDQ